LISNGEIQNDRILWRVQPQISGRERSARTISRAETTNPMPLGISGHRVTGADGGLHGYGEGEGLETKAWLLKLKKRVKTKE
jgi:O6-methylguanine-DNA--protein-cysteine methyltransferase